MDPVERFSGLSNQGATCYMNSLLQTLFMTPEFLSRIYQWRWDESRHHSKKLCIPYQLQLMFAKLHLRHTPVVETTGLTTSFQWDLRECLQQHDVQEFCRVLFDAIEESVKGTDQEKMITELYEGNYVDYVKCLQCGHESIKEDKFLDLSLAVRGHSEYNDSLEKALKGFTRPDMLCGDNKYFCENCNEKTDAKKGLKFSKIPLILAIQLKRFDLDYSTMQRKKINDRVTFPLYLNMDKIIQENIEYSETEENALETNLDLKTNSNSPNSEFCKENYELFSIMIHSGSALGGHYMAYIKSFSTQKWYSFNDSIVKEIEEKELDKAIGGCVGNGIFGSNAYMFMYRKKSETNLISVNENEIPGYLLEDIKSEEEEKFRLQKQREERQLLTEVQIFSSLMFKTISVNKTISLLGLKRRVLIEWKLDIDQEDVRFRKYENFTDQLLDTFEGKEHMSLESLEITPEVKLWLETKLPEEDFLHYDPKGLHLRICVWREQPENCQILQNFTQSHYRFTVPLNYRLRDLLTFLTKFFKYPFDNIRLWRTILVNTVKPDSKLKDSYLTEITEPKNLNTKLLNLKISDGFILLMEEKMCKSKWKDFYCKQQSYVYIRYVHPKLNLISFPIQEEKSCTLGKLREKLAGIVEVESWLLTIRKGSKNGKKLLNEEQTLDELEIYNHCILYLDIDGVVVNNCVTLRVYYSALVVSGEDCEWNKFFELCFLNVDKEMSADGIKELIRDKVSEIYPSMGLKEFRIREKVDRRLLGVVKSLEGIGSYKCPEVCIEEFFEVDEDQVICLFRLWLPSTWDLFPPISLNIPRSISLEDLEEILQDYYDLEEDLEIVRITYLSTFTRSNLKSLDWIRMKGSLCQSPLFTETHGTCFV